MGVPATAALAQRRQEGTRLDKTCLKGQCPSEVPRRGAQVGRRVQEGALVPGAWTLLPEKQVGGRGSRTGLEGLDGAEGSSDLQRRGGRPSAQATWGKPSELGARRRRPSTLQKGPEPREGALLGGSFREAEHRASARRTGQVPAAVLPRGTWTHRLRPQQVTGPVTPLSSLSSCLGVWDVLPPRCGVEPVA